MSTLKTLFGSVQLRIPTISPLYGWLALVLLEIEFKTQEAYFWPEFLRQLVVANDKSPLEVALKVTENRKHIFIKNISVLNFHFNHSK